MVSAFVEFTDEWRTSQLIYNNFQVVVKKAREEARE
jgi:hypothetical protein